MTYEEMYIKAFSGAHVPTETAEKIMETARRARKEKRRPVRPAGRTALIIIASALLLTATACAIAGLSFGELPETVRYMWGIKDEPAPEYVSYESVSFAPDARAADVHHEGFGELYASINEGPRSENLFVFSVGAKTVTEEQYESYVWRLQVEGSDEFVRAVPAALSDGGAYSKGRLTLRSTLFFAPDFEGEIRVRLCGGYESEDGKSFDVRRVSAYVTRTVTRAYENISISFGEGISYENPETGEAGLITSVEIGADTLYWHYYCPGSYELNYRVYADKGSIPDKDEWLEKNAELMGWLNGAGRLLHSAKLELSDGTSIESFVGGTALFGEDDGIIDETRLFARAIDPQKVGSITVGGETFYR